MGEFRVKRQLASRLLFTFRKRENKTSLDVIRYLQIVF